MQTATLRILIGMALVALENFSTGLDYDKALLAGTSSPTASNGDGASSSSASSSSSSSSSGSPDAGSSNGSHPSFSSSASSQAEAQQQQQQAQQPLPPPEPLSGDLQLAVLFRSQKKQLLLDVIAGLAQKLKQVCL